ncbi:hypothetical protein CBR_g19377 [Chara braunii]|uniref:Reverse transcriptase domain-containing protein n=1 Tax=Chara braunii TaxID=69332 RepID=A0A388KXT3_CHABU|nr:hypothetical protein CBR_g19377 [Chara braunii]|eukprot:GBG74864.1 hypothetical protein CBR_g19377 [Chara braunii]
MATSKRDYEVTGLGGLGKWKRNGRLGKAYVIPKDKDLQHWRPIAPACGDPAVMAQRRCARAPNCLITRFPRVRHFNLRSAYEMKRELDQFGSLLQKEGCSMAMGRCYDIKEMFSSISHSFVKDAVSELVMYFEKRGWRQVRVANRGKLCQMSKTTRREEGYTTVKLDMLHIMVEYDLSHPYMMHGDVIRRQLVGIPMGKTTSPVLATVTCAMAEARFLSNLGADRRIVMAWRMVDDVSIVVGCTGEEESWERAERILQSFKSIYDEELKLIRKDEGAHTWQFIGGRMYVMAEPVQVHFIQETKNCESFAVGVRSVTNPCRTMRVTLISELKREFFGPLLRGCGTRQRRRP